MCLLIARTSQVLLGAILIFSCISRAQVNPNQPHWLPVNVFDRQGNIVRDLRRENFRVLIDGQSVEAQDAQYHVAPRRILILLDISWSMGTANAANSGKWRVACEAVAVLLAHTPEDAPIALIAFDKKVEHTIDFAPGRRAIESFIRGGTVEHSEPRGAALFDAINEGLTGLQPAQQGDALYVIGDGDDTASHTSPKRLSATLLKSGVRLFTLLFLEDSTFENRLATEDFIHIVQETGGSVFSISANANEPISSFNTGQVRTPSDQAPRTLNPKSARVPAFAYNSATREKLELFTQTLSSQIGGFYTLRIPVASSSKQRKVTLHIVDDKGELQKNVEVVYPRAISPDR